MENILNYDELMTMRKAGKVAANILYMIRKVIRPGITTKDVESFFINYLDKFPGMESAFYGYNGYPGAICVSKNDEVIHGIPKDECMISEGDLVSVDLGIKYEGVYVDCAWSYAAGKVSDLVRKLIKVGREALRRGIAKARPGKTVGDIGHAIQTYVEENGFSVVRKFVGHGIGRQLHCSPEVPNFGNAQEGQVLKDGMVLAIEPMISSGGHQVEILNDGWTARTKDRSLSSHFEHSVAITRKGPWVLTQ